MIYKLPRLKRKSKKGKRLQKALQKMQKMPNQIMDHEHHKNVRLFCRAAENGVIQKMLIMKSSLPKS